MSLKKIVFTRDQKKLMQYDAELIDLRYLYERERMREIDIGKSTLLLSRAFKNKIERLERARLKLSLLIKDTSTQKASYYIELARRKDNLSEAELSMASVEKDLEKLGLSMMLNPSEQTIFEFKELTKEIKTARARITNRERALDNWLKRTNSVKSSEVRRSRADAEVVAEVEEEKEYSPDYDEEESETTSQYPVNDEILKAAMKYQELKEAGIDLSTDKKPINNANIDLLAQFVDSTNEIEPQIENSYFSTDKEPEFLKEDKITKRVTI